LPTVTEAIPQKGIAWTHGGGTRSSYTRGHPTLFPFSKFNAVRLANVLSAAELLFLFFINFGTNNFLIPSISLAKKRAKNEAIVFPEAALAGSAASKVNS
jgi:hypothetical protein